MCVTSLTVSALLLGLAGLLSASRAQGYVEPESLKTGRAVQPLQPVHNLIATNLLQDGERETRIHFDGITAKETSIGPAEKPLLHLRQVTDGHHLIQLIYSGEREDLRDCEYVSHRPTVRAFLDTFHHDMEAVRHGNMASNVTMRVLVDGESLPEDVASWLDYGRLRTACKNKHLQMKKLFVAHDQGHEPATNELERVKRSLQDAMMAPGTKWCGRHHRADLYSALGAFSRTDRCCRRHDQCKMAIPAFSTKFSLFNWRPFTLSYCGCDKRFRTCLKMAGNAPANMVGKLFFNVVQTKCFVLKPKKVCRRSSWWGKCEKWEVKKQAHLRDNTPY